MHRDGLDIAIRLDVDKHVAHFLVWGHAAYLFLESSKSKIERSVGEFMQLILSLNVYEL